MLLIVMIAAAVGVGMYAHERKSRNGLVWGGLIMAAQLVVMAAVTLSVLGQPAYGSSGGDFATGVMTVCIGGGLMGLIVAFVPPKA